MQINSNLTAVTNRLLALNMEKLASGQRINRAGDDAAGLAISEKMRAQTRGLNMASRNASDSISMVRTGEGALEQTHANLQRMRELAVQASNDTYTDSDRSMLQAEFGQLRQEIDRIGNTTEFNTMKLLDGSATSVTTQAGANSGQTASVSMGDMRAAALGVVSVERGGVDANGAPTTVAVPIDISTKAGASLALEAIDSAIEKVSSQRSLLGASENRFEYTVRNLDTAAENQQAAESRIRDADMAREIMKRTTNSILLQTSMAMASQANMAQQNVLRLLG